MAVDDYATDTKSTPVQKVEYAYDPFDRRVATSVDETGKGYIDRREMVVYDRDDVLLDFVDADGEDMTESPALARRYLHGPLVDQILAQEDIDLSTGDMIEDFWHLSDHLGTVRDLVDANGDIAEHYNFDAFGNLVEAVADPLGTPSAVTETVTRYLFTGRERDGDTGLQYNRARWYDAAVGRWLSEDPIGFAAGDANLYRYVGNGATYAQDPTGRFADFSSIPHDSVDGDSTYHPHDSSTIGFLPNGAQHSGTSLPWTTRQRMIHLKAAEAGLLGGSESFMGVPLVDMLTPDEKAALTLAGKDQNTVDALHDLFDTLHELEVPAFLGDADDTPLMRVYGSGGHCHEWAQTTISLLLDRKLREGAKGVLAPISFEEIRFIYTVNNPLWRDHRVIKVTLRNGKSFYIDNFWLGGKDDHIFFTIPATLLLREGSV